MSSIYRTNIISGFNPDPSIVRVGNDYFIVTSSFEYFPALPIYHSTDLVNWKLIGHAMTRRSQLDMRTVEAGGGIYAPTLRYNKGSFYIACGAIYRCKVDTMEFIDPRGFIIHTDNIFDTGSWSDPVFIDNLGIDQDIFFDDDDRAYLSVCQHIHEEGLKRPSGSEFGLFTGIYTCEIDIKTGRNLSEPVFLRSSKLKEGIAEGSHLYKRDGWYYLSTAEGGTDENHQQMISRSRNVLGPYEEAPPSINPVIYNGDHPEVRNTGHMDMVEGVDGRWWAVFLGIRPQGDKSYGSHIGRETFLAPMKWVDGWPVVNGRERVGLIGHAEGLEMVAEPTSWRDDFRSSGEELAMGWYSLRTPLKREYSLTERPGTLTLYGNAYRLDVDESPAMVLQKQTQFSVDWSTELDFSPTQPGQEAGTTVWWSKVAYASLGIRGVKGSNGKIGRELVFRSPNAENAGDKSFSEKSFALSDGPVYLVIKARPTNYEFSFSQGGGALESAGHMSAGMLRRGRRCDSHHCGTFFGLYAMGVNNKPCFSPAYFSYAMWKTVEERKSLKRSLDGKVGV